MGFQFFHAGKAIFSDAGTYTYQYDQPERIFIESTRAHNCLEIDGLDYSRFRSDSFGSCIDYAIEVENCLFLEGTVSRSRLIPPDLPYNKVKNEDCQKCNIKQKRIILYLPRSFLIIIDELTSDQERNYTQWLNLAPDMYTSIDEDKIVINDSDEVKCILRDLSSQPVEIGTIRGQTSPRLQGWTSINGHTLTEVDSIKKSVKGKKIRISTMVDLEFEKTKKVTLNSGSKGRYLRVVVEQRSRRIEMKIRRRSEEFVLEFIDSGKSCVRKIKY